MDPDADSAKAAVEALWIGLDDLQRQALVMAISRAASAGVTVTDLLEWLDAFTYADHTSE